MSPTELVANGGHWFEFLRRALGAQVIATERARERSKHRRGRRGYG